LVAYYRPKSVAVVEYLAVMENDKECSPSGSHKPVQRQNKFDGFYETPDFMIWCYKVLPCAKVSLSVRERRT
jgi:hypothetical protein